MRVLITQPAQEAAVSARALAARGHEPIIIPLVTVERENAPAINLTSAQGFLATSPEGVRALAEHVGVRTFPIFVDSDLTAAEARRVGFKEVLAAKDDSQDLARLVERSLKPANGALVYACSTAAPINLGAMLGNMGFAVRPLPLYSIKRVAEIPRELHAKLNGKGIDVALFMSADEARAFVTLIQRDKTAPPVTGLKTVAATPAIAAPLRALRGASVTVASASDPDSVWATLDGELIDKVEDERRAREKAEAERAAREKRAEEERIERERLEAERQRIAKEETARAEIERLAREEERRVRAEEELRRKEEAERERAEKLAREKAEKERLAAARAAREEAERQRLRKEKEEREHLRVQEEARVKAERARLAAETAARAKAEREHLAAARAAREDAERERLRREKEERERIAAEQVAHEKAEREQRAREKAARDEAARVKSSAEKAERDRLAAERLERERIERDAREKERAEKERVAREEAARVRAEDARIAAEREKSRLEHERVAREDAERARAEQERLARETAETERLAREKRAEEERIERARRSEEDRIEKEKRTEAARRENERLAQERAEHKRVKAEQAARDAERKRILKEEAAAQKARDEHARRDGAAKARAEQERLADELAERRRVEKEESERTKAERKRLAGEHKARARAEKARLSAERKPSGGWFSGLFGKPAAPTDQGPDPRWNMVVSHDPPPTPQPTEPSAAVASAAPSWNDTPMTDPMRETKATPAADPAPMPSALQELDELVARENHGKEEDAESLADAKPAARSGGGRSAQMQAEDAADERMRDRLANWGRGDPETPLPHDGEPQTSPIPDAPVAATAVKRRGPGRSIALFFVLATIATAAMMTSHRWLPLLVKEPPAPIASAPMTSAPAPTPAQVKPAPLTTIPAPSTPAATMPPAPAAPPAGEVSNQTIAALMARVATLEAALGNTTRLDEISRRVESLAGRSADANSVLALADRVTALEQTARSAADQRAVAVALTIAATQWRDAVVTGRPFLKEWDTVKALNGQSQTDAVFAKYAGAGLPALAEMQHRFDVAAAAAVRASYLPNDTASWLRRTLDRVFSVISIRRTDVDTGDGVDAVLVRAERAADGGNLAGAVAEMRKLTGASLAAATPWIELAEARVAAEEAAQEAVIAGATAFAAPAAAAPSPKAE